MDRYLIYALTDPRTSEIRYIGRSSSGMKRPKSHWQDASLRNRADYCHNWVRSVLSAGYTPGVIVLESWNSASNEQINNAEIRQIALRLGMGCKLTNLTAGGEGSSGCVRSAATRKKISEARLGKKLSPFTPEHKAKIAGALRGRKPSAACQLARQIALSGKPNWNRKRVLRSDGVVFNSLSEAAKGTDAAVSSVSQAVSGKLKTLKGFTFSVII